MKVFVEEQKFTQLWFHVILLMSFIVPVILVIKDYINSSRDNESSITLIIVLVSVIFVYGFIFSLKLKTRIDENGIQFQFIPFHFVTKSITWSEIDKVYVRKYNAITEYGGWGMKGGILWRKSKSIAYNVKGTSGLQFELKNGKKILIGTQKEDEIKKVLNTYSSKFMNSIK